MENQRYRIATIALALAFTFPTGAYAATLSDTSILNVLSGILKTFSAMLSQQQSAAPAPNYVTVQSFAQSQRIDNLANTTISNPTITGGSITAASIAGTISNAINTALGTIVSLGGTELTYTRATFESATTTNLYASSASIVTASTTNLTVNGSATSTFAGGVSTARLNATATSTLSGLVLDGSGLRFSALNCSSYGNSGKLTTDAFGNVVCAADQGGAGSTVGGADTQIQFNNSGSFGASINFTFSSSANKLTVTNASTTNLTATYASSTNLFAGTLTLSSPLSASSGGTGISSVAAAGVLLGNYAGTGWQQLATSSLGLLTSNVAEGANLYFTNNRAASVIAGTTTDALAEGSTNKYYTDTRVSSYISGSSTVPHIGGMTYGDLLSWTGSTWTTRATSTLALITDSLIEGSNNLFWTNTRFDNRLTATTTLPNLTTLAGLASIGTITSGTWQGSTISAQYGGTGSTTLTGILKGNGTGAVKTAVGGTDYEFPLTFSTGLNRSGNTITNTGVLSLGSGYATSTGTWITFSTTTQSFNGLTIAQQISNPNGSDILFTPALSGTLNNSGLANSTISGISLGSNLASLAATDGTLTFSGSYNGGTARSVGLNLGNANSWTGLQQFNNASTTLFSAYGPAYFGGSSTSSFSSTGVLTLGTALSVGSGGTGASALAGLVKGNGTSAFTAAVAGTDYVAPATTITAGTGLAGGGDLSINRTFSLNLANANSWTGLQQLANSSSTLGTITTGWATNFNATYASSTALTVSGNTYLTTLNVTGNATFANATTTILFSTTASSTNLFANSATLGSLTAGDLILAGGPRIDIRSFGAIGNGVTDDWSSLNAATTSIGSANRTLVISVPLLITKGVSFPANISVVFERGGRLIGNAGTEQVTFSAAPPQAGLYQIFQNLVVRYGFGGTIYPEWFGAIGDGTTNDRPAIQSAIDALVNRGVVKLAAKYYAIDDQLTISNSYVSLLGDGQTATRLYVTGANKNGILLGSTTPVSVPTVANLSIFHGTGGVSPCSSACIGIMSSSTAIAKIHDVQVDGFLSGISLRGAGNTLLTNVESSYEGSANGFIGYDFDGSGHVGGNASSVCTNCWVSAATSPGTNSIGFKLHGAYISDLIFDSPATASTYYGFNIDYSSVVPDNSADEDVEIRNPIIDQFSTQGIFVSGSSNESMLSIEGGWINPKSTGAETDAVYVTGARGVTVSGMQFYADANHANAYGLRALNSSNIVVTGNQFVSQEYGVHFTNVTDSSITSNRFFNIASKPATNDVSVFGGKDVIVSLNNFDGTAGIGAYFDSATANSSALGNISSSTVTTQVLNQSGGGVSLLSTRNGLFGIGTTSPGATLDVAGSFAIENGTPDQFLFTPVALGTLRFSGTGATNNLQMYDGVNSYLMDLYSGVNDNVRLFSAGDSWFNGGNFGIGTASPGGKLGVVWASATQGGLVLKSSDVTLTGSPVLFYNSVNGLSGYIGQTTSAVSYNTTSDRRLKENIATTTAGLSTLMQIPVDDFNFISDPTQTRVQGFIAQDLYKYYPEAVTTNGDNGVTPLGASSTPWAVDYGRIAPLLAKAIQDIANLSDAFKNTLIAWLGSAANGIADLFAQNGHFSNQLCVGSTCVTAAQFQAIVAAANASGSGSSATASASNATSSSTSEATDTPPVIQVNGANPATIHVGDSYSDLGVTITGPQADLNLGIKTFLNGTLVSNIVIDTSAAATDTIDYVATDNAGNAATSTRTVIIEAQAPSVPVVSNATTSAATSTAQ